MTSFQQITSIGHIAAEQWNSLLTSPHPFLDHRFLHMLETTGCVTADTGWEPCHAVLLQDKQLLAAMPMYLKRHSYGEYVFDWGWAEAYARNGLDYFPKYLTAVPFTPTNGPRMLGQPHHQQELLQHIKREVDQQPCSGWHINYPDPTLHPASVLQAVGLQQRQQCQFHWYNRGYQSFDDFLSGFASRKRKSVKKERRRISEQHIQVDRILGKDISDDDLRFFYQCYRSTYAKRGSTPYLSFEFFQQLQQQMPEHCLFIIARQQQQERTQNIAAALCLFDNDTLYGRYWGALDEVDGLHFEVCYYQGIEFCIEHRLSRFDPGTQGEHKISRGFEPVITTSYHYLKHDAFNDAVSDFIRQETPYVMRYQTQARELLPFNQEWYQQHYYDDY